MATSTSSDSARSRRPEQHRRLCAANAFGRIIGNCRPSARAALRPLVRSAGAELAPRGIRVNAVSPGPIATPFHGKLGLSEKQLANTGETITAAVPLKRFGRPLEIAKASLSLASDDASFVTGIELVVDGGLPQF
ncbi:SDR family oxidoreductase [Caballeronia hypogeia]|uniref:SDR family oxidoreductase n=1 Tax=Caballeronia hypogeia TaxID=1777140 RepID=UPI0009EEB3D7|nr:SDR family oxidoreductase [Caballeronia hypogeia]